MVPYHLAICEDSSLIREEVCGFCEDILTDHKITYDLSLIHISEPTRP